MNVIWACRTLAAGVLVYFGGGVSRRAADDRLSRPVAGARTPRTRRRVHAAGNDMTFQILHTSDLEAITGQTVTNALGFRDLRLRPADVTFRRGEIESCRFVLQFTRGFIRPCMARAHEHHATHPSHHRCRGQHINTSTCQRVQFTRFTSKHLL